MAGSLPGARVAHAPRGRGRREVHPGRRRRSSVTRLGAASREQRRAAERGSRAGRGRARSQSRGRSGPPRGVLSPMGRRHVLVRRWSSGIGTRETGVVSEGSAQVGSEGRDLLATGGERGDKVAGLACDGVAPVTRRRCRVRHGRCEDAQQNAHRRAHGSARRRRGRAPAIVDRSWAGTSSGPPPPHTAGIEEAGRQQRRVLRGARSACRHGGAPRRYRQASRVARPGSHAGRVHRHDSLRAAWTGRMPEKPRQVKMISPPAALS